MVNRKDVVKISSRVSRKFPELAGAKPSVKKQSIADGDIQYLLTYRGQANLPGGHKMSRIVRVVADTRGKIIKISTSK